MDADAERVLERLPSRPVWVERGSCVMCDSRISNEWCTADADGSCCIELRHFRRSDGCDNEHALTDAEFDLLVAALERQRMAQPS